MQFGKRERTEIIDDNGSTLTRSENVASDEVVKPVRLHYEIRHRTDKTDLATIAKIAQTLLADPTKLDAALKLERTKSGEAQGTFNLVECYTVLEY